MCHVHKFILVLISLETCVVDCRFCAYTCYICSSSPNILLSVAFMLRVTYDTTRKSYHVHICEIVLLYVFCENVFMKKQLSLLLFTNGTVYRICNKHRVIICINICLFIYMTYSCMWVCVYYMLNGRRSVCGIIILSPNSLRTIRPHEWHRNILIFSIRLPFLFWSNRRLVHA